MESSRTSKPAYPRHRSKGCLTASFLIFGARLNYAQRRPSGAGSVVLVAGDAGIGKTSLAQVPSSASYLANVLPGFLAIGTGLGFSFVASPLVVMADVHSNDAGLASGLMQTAHEIGISLGIASLSAVATAAAMQMGLAAGDRQSMLARTAAPRSGSRWRAPMLTSKPVLLTLAGIALIASVALLATASYFWVQIPFVKFRLQATECKWGPPLTGVYLSGRLELVDRCATVSGTVDCVKNEPDGDVHIRLRLDPQYTRLLRPANSLQTCVDQPGPHLVVEIIPQHPAGLFRSNNADAGGFISPAKPKPGDHIVVTGPYVVDTNVLHRVLYQGRPAENWAEIHPAWGIEVDHPATPNQPNQPGPEFGD